MSNLSASERVYRRWGYPLPPLAGADDGTPAPAPPAAPPAAEAPPAAPTQVTPQAPAAPAPPAAPTNPGPWAADLERFFPDEPSRQAADRFMREYVQPSRTQFEQEVAPMRELYQDLVTNPRETLAAIAGELFADEQSEYHDASLAEQLAGIFGGEQQPEAPVTPPAGEVDQLTLDRLPPEVREMYEEHAAQKQTAEYNRVVDGFIEQSEVLTPEDKNALGPWISATGGDLQQAEQAYLNYKQQLLQQAGVQPQAEPTPPAPVIGGQAVTPAGAPPSTQQYTRWEDLDKAVDDYSAEQRRGPVPPVGAV